MRGSCRAWSLFILAGLFTTGPRVLATPLGSAFTYQGSLDDSGNPATGTYDINFKLFDAGAAGNLIGVPITYSSLQVAGGLFTVQLDFGAMAFNGDNRWLEIAVKPSAGGNFTALAPRQMLTTTPYALQSRGMFVDQNLNVTLGGQLQITQAPKFVGVGRTTQVSGAEVFGIQGTTGPGGYAGMYVNTSDAGGWPFYGYATAGNTRAWTYLDGVDGKWKLSSQGGLGQLNFLTVDLSLGRVGINTTTPDNTLHVFKSSAGGAAAGNPNAPLVVENGTDCYVNLLTPDANESGILFGEASNSASGGIIYNNPNHPKGLEFRTNGNATQMVLTQNGNLGIGTNSAGSKVQILASGNTDGLASVTFGNGQAGSFKIFNSNTSSNALVVTSSSNNAAALFVQSTGAAPAIDAVGTIRTDVLEVTGADLAEKIPTSEDAKPGTVMAIDRKNPGKLCIAHGAYNRCVAGVVSGANNLPAGTILGNLPGSEKAPPIALSGRVWVQCDATQHAIEPGDQMTTSDRPGLAMSVSDQSRAAGSTLGKAMTGLKKGETGLVLVLVNLQ